MNDHRTHKNSHVYEHHNIPGHKIDFENVEILVKLKVKLE